MAQIQFHPNQIHDFRRIRDSDVAILHAGAISLSRLNPPPLRPADLFAAAMEAFQGDELTAESVVRQCLALHGVMRNSKLGVDEVTGAVRSAIERDTKGKAGDIDKWLAIEPAFRELLEVDAFRIVAAAIDLSYEYANLFRTARIITDIRPLFTHDATGIEGAVVSFTFRLRFDSADGEHELSIAMDESDVQQLIENCRRALTKATTAQNIMKTKAEIPTIITGGGDDATVA